MMRQSNPNRVVNRKIDLDQFLHRRPQVLGQWQTGADVDIDEAIAFHHAMPAARNFARKVVEADRANETLAIPRVGDPVLDEHIAHLKTCAAAGADLLPSITDGYTRFNQWQRAADGLEDCARQGRSLLNGFPIVAHGPTGVRRLVEESGLPVMNNCGSVLVPLVAEVGFAGGMTALLGTPVAYCLNHHADVPFDEAIRQYQYVDRLVAWYGEQGVPLHREFPAQLTATLVPFGVAHAIAVTDALLLAEQGVRYLSVGINSTQNMVQDVAGMRAVRALTEEYLRRFGYDVTVTTSFYQWMGAFPTDPVDAKGLVATASVIGVLSGATYMWIKSFEEALGVTTPAGNAESIRLAKYVMGLMGKGRYPDCAAVRAETEWIERQARAIVEKMLEMGDGDIARGVCMATNGGILDIPFASTNYMHGRVVTVKDGDGMIRYLETANLPFDKEILEYNDAALRQRPDKVGSEADLDAVVHDIVAVANGRLVA